MFGNFTRPASWRAPIAVVAATIVLTGCNVSPQRFEDNPELVEKWEHYCSSTTPEGRAIFASALYMISLGVLYVTIPGPDFTRFIVPAAVLVGLLEYNRGDECDALDAYLAENQP